MTIMTKICGLSSQESVEAAIHAGASFLGFIFFPPSPRYVLPVQAQALTKHLPSTIKTVAVIVDNTNEEIEDLLKVFSPDFLQLHGKETPARTKEIAQIFSLPIIKSVSIRSQEDLLQAERYEDSCMFLLFDAKAPVNSVLPGGNGITFDWHLLHHYSSSLPWFLAGGLNCQNVREAIAKSGAQYIDVSSGVEIGPGIKSNSLIKDFLAIVRSID